jgi:hypothetical protein
MITLPLCYNGGMKLSPQNIERNFWKVLTLGLFLVMPQVASAATLLPACATNTGVSSTPDLYCAINTAKYLFGIMGSAALVMFVAGGFFIVAAGGRDAWVKKGKEYIKNAVIGIVIILLSGYAIQYGVNSLRGGVNGTECNGEYYTADDKGTQECCAAPNVVIITGGKFSCGKVAE